MLIKEMKFITVMKTYFRDEIHHQIHHIDNMRSTQ